MTRFNQLGLGRDSARVLLGTFDLTTARDGDTEFIDLEGELDYARIPEVDHEIRRAEKGDARLIVVSLRDVTSLDTAALTLLLDARIRLAGSPGRLRFLPSHHRAVLELLDATHSAGALYTDPA